jgi:acylpyruvate hydrolase
MRYATYQSDEGPRLGLVRGDTIHPLRDVRVLGPETTSEVLLAASADTRLRPVAMSQAKLLPVSPNPAKILCVGLNYRSHIGETGRDTPAYPVLFPKFSSSLIGHGAPVELPPESAQVDYEAELAVVIGRPARRVARAQALDHVLGYTIANDVTMRDYQYKTHQWLQGKAWDRSTPIGPTLVTPDEVDASALDISLKLNGTELQRSSTSRMIFDVPRLIEVITEFTELLPGDVILTGTPGGVGFRRDPQVFLGAGDDVAVEISGIGTLRNPVTLEPR